MGLTGKTTPFVTLKRQDVQQQKSTGIGYQNLAFAHQATAGQTGIDLTSLVAPSGFLNPSPSALLNANLGFYQNNLILVSSSKGMLIPNLSYTTSGAQRINFVGFTAEQDEIFYGAIQANPRTGLMAVDARSIGVTGSLAVGATDFNVGQLFKVNDNPTQQVGQVVVFRNSISQFRCVGNNIANEGDYVELDLGNGYGQVIRFKLATAAPDADSLLVISNGLIAEKPDASQLAEVERVAGQLDRIIPYVAAAASVDEADLRQYNPTNTDLKAFGDQVLDHENRLDAIEAYTKEGVTYFGQTPSSANPTTSTTVFVAGSAPNKNTLAGFNTSTGVLTAQKAGWYSYTLRANAGQASSTNQLFFQPRVNGGIADNFLTESGISRTTVQIMSAGRFYLTVGQTLDFTYAMTAGSSTWTPSASSFSLMYEGA